MHSAFNNHGAQYLYAENGAVVDKVALMNIPAVSIQINIPSRSNRC
jgi:hypothetical protein